MHLSRRQYVISAALAVVAVAFAVMAVKGDSQQAALRARGVRTEAMVVDRIPQGRSPDLVVVRFTTTAGRQVDERLPANDFVDNDSVAVVYDPENPANVKKPADLTTAADDLGSSLFGAGVCTLLLVGTLTNKLKWRRRPRPLAVTVAPQQPTVAVAPPEHTMGLAPQRQAVDAPPREPVPSGQEGMPPVLERRSAGEQLHRSPRVMHASWLTGLMVFIAGGGLAGGFNIGGLIFLVLVFLPVVVAWRRDRLSFPIIFASIFLLGWPWAMYKAVSGAPKAGTTTAP